MRERPILFGTKMVQAILDGRKTCTRRIVKPQPKTRLCYTHAGGGCRTWGYPSPFAYEIWGEGYKLPDDITKEDLAKRWKPPYYSHDILYVRETWGEIRNADGSHKKYVYKASDQYPFGKSGDIIKFKWKPSIHMPKEAARIWLQVTEMRVGRLQDITEAGAINEGCINDIEYAKGKSARNHFVDMWNNTIKKSDIDIYGWDADPYVWVIEFEQCEKPPECILKGYDKAPNDGEKCLGYAYDDNRDTLLPTCAKCRYQASYESEE